MDELKEKQVELVYGKGYRRKVGLDRREKGKKRERNKRIGTWRRGGGGARDG